METRPLFQLCGEVSGDNEKYFLFPKVFNYWFYKSWCFNMGGNMVVPNTDEEYHSDMDIAESMVDPQTHEKCLHATGALILWAGFTDEYEESVWVNPYTKEEVTTNLWSVNNLKTYAMFPKYYINKILRMPGNPNGGAKENCARTYIGKC